MCCTFNTSREALSYVGNHYAEILEQADQHHARIIDIVKHAGTICVVVDFIEGENLADKLKEVER